MARKLKNRFRDMNEDDLREWSKRTRNQAVKLYDEKPKAKAKGGKRKDLDNIYFRSSWEANMARFYNFHNIKWEFEPREFYFEGIRKGCVSYTPDFYLRETDEWIEVKGYMDARSRTKLNRFKKYYPEEYKKLTIIDGPKYKEIEKLYNRIIEHWE